MLLGRTAELALVGGLLEGARHGTSAALVVHGEPGIGKTALLDEVVREAVGFTVLRAHPLEAESELPFAGLFDLLRPLLGLLRQIPAPQAAVLSGALALGPPTPGDRFTAAAATMSLLAVGAEHGPLLAVIDDLQWLDTPSREAVMFAARRLGSEGAVIVMATRDEPWLAEEQVRCLELRGLSRLDAAELAESTAPAMSAVVRDRLVVVSGGNPLALLEALAGLTAQGAASGEGERALPEGSGPDPQGSLARRLEPLPGQTRLALLVVAASDSDRSDEVARALDLLGLPPSALDAAERAGLLRRDLGRWRLRHPLLRSAVLDAAGADERRTAHRALAGALDPGEQDRVAWHLAAAADGPDEGAAALLEQSAGRFQARHGYAAAGRALAESARLSASDEECVRRTMGAADAYRLGGDPRAAAELLAPVLDLVTDPLVRADLQQLRGVVMYGTDPIIDVFGLLTEEAARVEPFDPNRAATLLVLAASGVVGAAEVELSRVTAAQALELSGPGGGPAALMSAVSLSFALTLAGRVGEARATLAPIQPLLTTLDPLGPAALPLAAAAHLLSWQEDWPAAMQLLEHVLTAARANSAITVLPHPLAVLGELELQRGRIARAYAAATQAVQIAAETGQDTDSTFGLVGLARVEALLGLEAECRAHVGEALAVARRIGLTSAENYSAAVLGMLELGLGHPDRALPHLRTSAQMESEYGVGMPNTVQWNGDLIETCVRLGLDDEAQRQVRVLEGQVETTGSRWARAVAARGRGLLDRPDSYEVSFATAIAIHGDDQPFERARTELCLARRRRADGRHHDSTTMLQRALSRFEALGAEPWAAQARAELVAGGDSVPISRGESLLTLTPQELQVALIVASGATNVETASTLFISPKTVESHLGHVYRKLGLRSRSELARRVADLT